jgi:predicted outer membrane protein
VVNPLVFLETFELKIKPSTNKGLNKQIKTRQLCTTLQTRGLLSKDQKPSLRKVKKELNNLMDRYISPMVMNTKSNYSILHKTQY